MTHWPSTINAKFWPFAIRQAVNLHNISVKGRQTKSPYELFMGESPPRHPKDFHTFGSPAYVLRKELQDNPGSARKWERRCWQGVYVGMSSLHASSVSLIYKPTTCHVTQQFHVTHDDTFHSVLASPQTAADAHIDTLLESTDWLFKDPYEQVDAVPLTTNPPDSCTATACLVQQLHQPQHRASSTPKPKYSALRGSASFEQWKHDNNIHAFVHCCTHGHSTTPNPTTSPDTSATTHTHQPSAHFGFHAPLSYSPDLGLSVSEGAGNISEPHTYQAALQSQDTLTQSAMLKTTDRDAFLQAQTVEIKGLHDNGIFSYHHISTLPPKARLLNAIWSYKRK